MKKAILIQSRLSSKRFPKKMLQLINGVPLVEFVYRRCCRSSGADVVSVITSADPTDDELSEYCSGRGIDVFRGSLHNVLKRYIDAAAFYEAPLLSRVCGDSPFVDVTLIDAMFQMIENECLDYVAPNKETCIAGLDSEVVTLSSLKRVLEGDVASDELEHVTLHIKNNREMFKARLLEVNLRPTSLSNVSLTVDYPEDMTFCCAIAEMLGGRFDFSSSEILQIVHSNGFRNHYGGGYGL
ncbi:MAG: hypothetical protein AB1805_03255 [Nitrospirota bacterium]